MNYVYYLFSSDQELLYVGRTDCLRRRKSAFERRNGISVHFGICQRFSDFERACQAELKAIERHSPPFNQKLVSAKGFLGGSHSTMTRGHIGKKNRGRSPSPETRQKISVALLGRSATSGMKGKRMTDESIQKLKTRRVSAETRARMSISGKKKIFSDEHRKNLSIAIKKARNAIPNAPHI